MAQRTQIIPLAEQFEPAMQKEIIRAFNALRTRFTVAQLTEMIQFGGIEAVLGAFDDMEEVLSAHFLDEFDAATLLGGTLAAEFIPTQGILNGNFRYSSIDPRTAEFIRTYEFDLIKNVSNNTREAVRNALIDGNQRGINPREQARNFRNSLGLAPNQEKWVRNYRRQLTELDRGALGRTLRDGRFDSTIINAIENNQPLSEPQVEKMVQRYRERLVLKRSETIARTESLRAISIGQEEGIQQMLAEGVLDTDSIRQFWIFTPGERTRAWHRSIPSLNPAEGIPLGESFKTALGPLKYPRDPAGSAANTINCRCRRVFRMIGEE